MFRYYGQGLIVQHDIYITFPALFFLRIHVRSDQEPQKKTKLSFS